MDTRCLSILTHLIQQRRLTTPRRPTIGMLLPAVLYEFVRLHSNPFRAHHHRASQFGRRRPCAGAYDWKSGPLPFIPNYPSLQNFYKPANHLQTTKRLWPILKAFITSSPRRLITFHSDPAGFRFNRKAGSPIIQVLHRGAITSLRFHRARRSDGCEHSQCPRAVQRVRVRVAAG